MKRSYARYDQLIRRARFVVERCHDDPVRCEYLLSILDYLRQRDEVDLFDDV